MTGLILVIVSFFGGLGSLFTSWLYSRYVKRWRHREVQVNHWPRAAVIAPYRGGIIRENVEALLAQEYPGDWEVIFVTTRKDASYSQLEDVANLRSNVKVVPAEDVVDLAGERGVHRGQKNHNFVTALSAVSGDTDVIAFIDSDVCPSPDWLRTLVEPLAGADVKIGATTFARLYMPGPGLASCTQAVWVIGSDAFLVGPWGYIWGGSFAIRRQILERTDILDRWEGRIGSISSDDLNLSVSLRKSRYRTCYVPGSKAVRKPPQRRETWFDVLRFTNRQLLHVWWVRKDLWLAAFLSHGVKSIAVLCSLCIAWLQPVALLALVAPMMDTAGFLITTHTLRSHDSPASRLHQSLGRAIILAGPLAGILAGINIIIAAFTTRMRWGGVEYSYRTVMGYTEDDSWKSADCEKAVVG